MVVQALRRATPVIAAAVESAVRRFIVMSYPHPYPCLLHATRYLPNLDPKVHADIGEK
jgi:hypothetical protein